MNRVLKDVWLNMKNLDAPMYSPYTQDLSLINLHVCLNSQSFGPLTIILNIYLNFLSIT